jgi:hypothetical protein
MMGLAAAVGLALTLTPGKAHAQFGNGGAKPLGAVLGVPVRALGDIIAANALQANVNVLHVSQAAFGGFNNQIATVAINQRNNGLSAPSGPAVLCKIPKIWLPAVTQINNNTTIVEQVAVGNGNTQVATVAVAQSNQAAKPGSTYLLVPTSLLGPLVQLNNNITIITQIAVGDGNTQVAVVNVDQSNGGNLNVPAGAVNPLVQINNNVTVITQVAVGSGNTQVATVNVGQSNG